MRVLESQKDVEKPVNDLLAQHIEHLHVQDTHDCRSCLSCEVGGQGNLKMATIQALPNFPHPPSLSLAFPLGSGNRH